MAYNDDLIRLIDQRVRAASAVTVSMGTIVDRDPAGVTATVMFDGSTVAVPCKIFGWQRVDSGERVGLLKFGSEWLVIGSYDESGLGEASATGYFTSTNTTTTASFADAGDGATVTFTKVRDTTAIRVGLIAYAYSTATATIAQFGVNVAGTDYAVGYLAYNVANQHMPIGGFTRITGIPAGTYTIPVRWRRISGAGIVNINGDDRYSFEVDEIRRAG